MVEHVKPSICPAQARKFGVRVLPWFILFLMYDPLLVMKIPIVIHIIRICHVLLLTYPKLIYIIIQYPVMCISNKTTVDSDVFSPKIGSTRHPMVCSTPSPGVGLQSAVVSTTGGLQPMGLQKSMEL